MTPERQRKIQAQKLNKLPEGPFKEIDLNTRWHPPWMTRAFQNNRYIVMIWDNAVTSHGIAIRAMVQKHSNTQIISHWSEMQRIKNEIFGEETVAVEYYPRESELMDDHCIYWLWIFPDGILPVPIMPKNIEFDKNEG